MSTPRHPTALRAADAPVRARRSLYPEPFASRMAGRVKHPLGDLFGLTNFGVNLTRLAPGMCAGFKAGTGDAHRLVNDTDAEVVYLEIGDRTPGDDVVYPDDDLQARLADGGAWVFTRKDGTPF